MVGTGANGGLPVIEEVERQAEPRKVELRILPTAQAIEVLQRDY